MEPCELTPADKFRLVHEEIHREHGLISNRVNWYVTSQSFLVAAFALCGDPNYRFDWMGWLIPSIGIGITVLMLASIIAGLVAMKRRRKEEFEFEAHKIFDDPKLLHWLGMLPALGIPLALLWAWGYCWVRSGGR